MRLLAGVEKPNSGHVAIDGDNLADVDAAHRARLVGYLPQASPRATGLAVYEVVLMGLYPLMPARGWESLAEWRRVVAALRRVGGRQLLRREFDRISGGEQRRVMLARAIVAEPPVLLLDEPLASLDPGFALELQSTLAELLAGGAAIVMATHNLELARRLADEVVLLRAGAVVERGAPADVMSPATLDFTYGTSAFGSGRA